MAEYELRNDEDGEPIECDCCGYHAPVADFDKFSSPGMSESFAFCEVCSSTYLSSAVKYPSQCPDPQLHRSVGWIANKILDTIRKRNNG